MTKAKRDEGISEKRPYSHASHSDSHRKRLTVPAEEVDELYRRIGWLPDWIHYGR